MGEPTQTPPRASPPLDSAAAGHDGLTAGPVANPQPSESRAAKTLREIFESGRPLTYIRSVEERRVSRVLREVSLRLPAPAPFAVWTWTLTEGLRRDGCRAEPGTQAPRAVLDFIAAHQDPAVFHLKDFHEPLRESPEVRRRLRDLYEGSLNQRKFVVISSPIRAIPEELERSLVFYDLRPPDLAELAAFVQDETGETGEAHLEQIARALQGLTLDEAHHAMRRALAAAPRLGPESLPALLEEKRLLVNRTGVVEYIATATAIEDVGGLDGLKQWLRERRKLFEMRESLSAEIVPKGVLFMGIPGCGKSLCVKAIASHFGLPLYRVDMIEIFSGRHGKPEGAFVEACRMLEDMAPAVLWFDEIEMAIISPDAGGEQGRIFAFFLTWMQEKARGLFVAATANRIDLLPAEMLRKGRFDEVFFVDLPLDEERVEIFRIHLARRGIDASHMRLEQLTQFTEGWTGAEIEQCVVSALTKARLEDRNLTAHDLVTTAVRMVPLSRTMKEQINHIRSWAFERAVRATPRPSGR
jgi:SpoVK/Ycf46/Vps4 family AAA+-type ATPase